MGRRENRLHSIVTPGLENRNLHKCRSWIFQNDPRFQPDVSQSLLLHCWWHHPKHEIPNYSRFSRPSQEDRGVQIKTRCNLHSRLNSPPTVEQFNFRLVAAGCNCNETKACNQHRPWSGGEMQWSVRCRALGKLVASEQAPLCCLSGWYQCSKARVFNVGSSQSSPRY